MIETKLRIEVLVDNNIRQIALGYLARREHSKLELQQKLQQKGFEFAAIQPTLEGLSREGLLSEERFTEAFIHSRLARGSGPLKIRAELQQRRICDALISQFLDQADIDWSNHAGAAREKRFGSQVPTEFKEKARQTRFLQQRGFSAEQVRAALKDDDS